MSSRTCTLMVLAMALSMPRVAQGQGTAGLLPERFTHVGPAQGLTQGTIYAFHQDRQGFMWMGTQDGLNRWDGHEMRVWKHDPLDERSLSQGYIRALMATDDDLLYIGTEGGGLDRLDLRTGLVERIRLPLSTAESAAPSVFCLATRPGGGLLVGGSMGLLEFDPWKGTFSPIPFPNVAPTDPEAKLVHALLVDADGTLWLATKYGLFMLPADGGRAVHHRHDPGDPGSLPKDNIKALHRDARGDLWVGTYGGGLCRSLGREAGFRSIARHDVSFVYGISEDRYGRLWVGAFNGLHVIDTTGRLLRSYHKDVLDERALKSELILATYSDRSGQIWVSTSGQGACLTDPGPDPFHVLDDRNSNGPRLTERFVYGIQEDAQGSLLIATAGGGVNVWDRASGSVQRLQMNTDGAGDAGCAVTRCAVQDSKGRLWVGTDKCGLFRRDLDGQWMTYVHRRNDPRSLPSQVVLTLTEDREGTIWVGTYNGGLARYNEATDDFTIYEHDPDNTNSLPGNIVRCILEDSDGALWIGTGGAGLSRFDRSNNTFNTYAVQPGTTGSITSNFVRTLHQDRLGRMWVGTNGGGLCLMQAGVKGEVRFVPFTMREGLSDNVIYGITEHTNGDLWLSTNAGLSALHTEQAVRSMTMNAGTDGPFITHYATHRGIQQGEFNGGAFLRDRNGWMYFGGVNGITWFHPDSIDRDEADLPVVLTDLQVRNRSVHIDTTQGRSVNHLSMMADQYRLDRLPNHIDTLVIPYAASLFSFTFSAIDFRDPDEASYYYALDGLDQDWNAIGKRRFVSFTNLDPGTYTLKLGASTSGRAPDTPGKVVRIIIVPPFWLTGWFRAALLIASALAVVLIVRHRHRKLRRENARMQQLVEDRTQQLSEQKLLVESRNSQLEDLNALNRRILSVISHDFKGPLISMRLLIDVLRDGRYERLDLHTSDIRNQLVQSELILQNLLDWARLELGEVQRPQPGTGSSAHAVVSSILAELQPMMKEKALTPVVALPAEQLVPVPLDALRIVYRNLISNALKYSPSGGTITCGFLPGSAEYFVQDEGSGIAPALAGRLFKGAVHAELGTHHEKGFGLGLYLTAELIADLGGTIRVETSATGSRFLFTFTPPK